MLRHAKKRNIIRTIFYEFGVIKIYQSYVSGYVCLIKITNTVPETIYPIYQVFMKIFCEIYKKYYENSQESFVNNTKITC
jgi:hypothetical protein